MGAAQTRADLTPQAVRVKGLVWLPLGVGFTAFDPLFETQAICRDRAQYDAERSARILAALEPAPAPDVGALDVDTLAQIIRRVDGGNRLGAGALAEAIIAAQKGGA